MKYMLLFCDRENWNELSEEQQTREMDLIGQWWGKHAAAGTILSGEQLQPPATATTVRKGGNGQALVSDGPFIEAKESIGGFGIVEVPDLDAAIALAKSWPGGTVEVRPLVTHDDH